MSTDQTIRPLPYPATTEALLFDCDGTLADSMPLHILAWQAAFAEQGIDLPAAFIDERAGAPTEQIVCDANVHYREQLDGQQLDPQSFSADKELRFERRLAEVEPILPVLATAQAAYGKLPMAVVSGGIAKLVAATLEHIDAAHLFPVVVTADDPVPGKPSPEIFREAARRLGVTPERCHVFEDGDLGIQAAQAAGMTWTDVRMVV